MANNTEQKRIATALETMAQIEPDKENNTEQQRIAAAVEALAEGGGGGGGGGLIIPTFTYDGTTTTCDMEFNEIVEAVENNQCPYAKAILYGSVFSFLSLNGVTYQDEDIDIISFSEVRLIKNGATGDYVKQTIIEASNGHNSTRIITGNWNE